MTAAETPKPDRARLDDAARAGWLYFIAGNTQEEIARKLNVSRPTAQRLVSLALSERLITFRLDHPIAACMELAARIAEKYRLDHADVVPADPDSQSGVVGIAETAASLLERALRAAEPAVIALGTGETLRAAAEQVPRMTCQQHKLISLVGHISNEGAGGFYDALARLSDLTQAPHYPTPLPVVVSSKKERDQLVRLQPVQRVRDLAAMADLTVVGVGRVDDDARLRLDGFVAIEELKEIRRLGAVGEIIGWAFDKQGKVISGGFNERLTSVPLEAPAARQVIGVAQGLRKVGAIDAALRGRLLNGLITNETTARALLALR